MVLTVRVVSDGITGIPTKFPTYLKQNKDEVQRGLLEKKKLGA
jgi:hypothetical protein